MLLSILRLIKCLCVCITHGVCRCINEKWSLLDHNMVQQQSIIIKQCQIICNVAEYSTTKPIYDRSQVSFHSFYHNRALTQSRSRGFYNADWWSESTCIRNVVTGPLVMRFPSAAVVLLGLWFLIARLMGLAWGPSEAARTPVVPMLAPCTLFPGITWGLSASEVVTFEYQMKWKWPKQNKMWFSRI